MAWIDNYEKVVKVDENYYLACYEKGFAWIPEKDFSQRNPAQAIKPVIRRVATGTTSQAFTEFRQWNASAILSTVFKSNENNLFFTFSTPSYGKKLNTVSYLLENFSGIWSAFDETNQKEYTNLAPGQYVFRVKNQWSNQEAVFAVEIAPPWYHTAWAMLAYGALLLLGALMAVRLHHHRVEVHKEKVRKRPEKKIRKQEEYQQQLIIQHQKEKLEQELVNKSEDLANSMMNLIKKNELLLQIKGEVMQIKEQTHLKLSKDPYHKLVRLIDTNLSTEQDWKLFETNFTTIHEAFFKRLMELYTELTPSDLRLVAYLRMNLSSKEIAQLLNITKGVELKRYRLRKRLSMQAGQNLLELMIKF